MRTIRFNDQEQQVLKGVKNRVPKAKLDALLANAEILFKKASNNYDEEHMIEFVNLILIILCDKQNNIAEQFIYTIYRIFDMFKARNFDEAISMLLINISYMLNCTGLKIKEKDFYQFIRNLPFDPKDSHQIMKHWHGSSKSEYQKAVDAEFESLVKPEPKNFNCHVKTNSTHSPTLPLIPAA
jgi:hypothetical protein